MIKSILYIAIIAALSSCFKDTSYNTRMIITPAEQLTSGGEFLPLQGTLAYAFNQVDTAEWGFASYEDAAIGVLTNKLSGEKQESFAQSTSYPGEKVGQIEIAIDRENIILLGVDTKNKIYGYTLYGVGLNLPTTYIYMPFFPWSDGRYTKGKWSYVAPEKEITE